MLTSKASDSNGGSIPLTHRVTKPVAGLAAAVEGFAQADLLNLHGRTSEVAADFHVGFLYERFLKAVRVVS